MAAHDKAAGSRLLDYLGMSQLNVINLPAAHNNIRYPLLLRAGHKRWRRRCSCYPSANDSIALGSVCFFETRMNTL